VPVIEINNPSKYPKQKNPISITSKRRAWCHITTYIKDNFVHNLINLFQKFVRHLLSGNRELIRQSGVSLLDQFPLSEGAKPGIQKDKVDERTLLQRSAISAIIPDPEQFKSSNDDGNLFYSI
jgi:hypothetical protein